MENTKPPIGNLTVSIANFSSLDPSIFGQLCLAFDDVNDRKFLRVIEPTGDLSSVQNRLNPKKCESSIMVKFSENQSDIQLDFLIGDDTVADKKIEIPYNKL
jgi:hypothetical protein